MENKDIVLENILARVELKTDRTDKLKVGILCAGGGQAGVFSAGVLYHMIDLGLSDSFDVAVGISAGAPNLANFLLKEKSAITIYWEENLESFINPWRFWKVVDLDRFEYLLRRKRKLDVQGIKNSPTSFYAGVTDLDGNGRFLDMKKSSDPIGLILATCSLPIAWNKTRAIDGNLYLDGMISLPLPVEKIAEQFSLTDLLVILNYTEKKFSREYSFWQKMLAHLRLSKFPSAFERAYLNKSNVSRQSLSAAKAGTLLNGCRISVISPPYDIREGCTDKKILQAFAEEGRKQARIFFEK